MVWITGDCHGQYDKFSLANFPQQQDMTREDTVLVCGDFGVWHDCEEERAAWDALAEKPFTVAFADGNHENFDRLYSDEFPVVDFHGGKAHKIRENLYHLLRGHVFDFDGKKFFVFGGAQSHDIQDGILDRADYSSDQEFSLMYYCWRSVGKLFRVNHESWWKQELPSPEEMEFGRRTLRAHGNKTDYIVTHSAPARIAAKLGFDEDNALGAYFDELADTVDFQTWYFGHYHYDVTDGKKYVMLMEQIVRVC